MRWMTAVLLPVSSLSISRGCARVEHGRQRLAAILVGLRQRGTALVEQRVEALRRLFDLLDDAGGSRVDVTDQPVVRADHRRAELFRMAQHRLTLGR